MRNAVLLFLAAGAVGLQAQVPSPKDFLGHDVCEDYYLANYEELTAYWRELERRSNRIRLVSIGTTEHGRDQLMAIISDPANLRNLETHRRNSERIAMADFRSDDEARAFVANARAVVWIDGGLHSNETISTQQLIESAYQFVARNDEENRRILRDVIILLVHANPDGMDLVSNWYMRRENPRERSIAGLPELYQKYIGHDNNRDFYMSNMIETRNMNHVLYRQWYPQIVYNHHQSSPRGTIMYIPPFRNPFNFHVDPLVQINTDLVGTHMHRRLISEGKGGTVMRNAAAFSAWWNGGLRTTTYFHNMIGILTETWGSPTPTSVPWLNNRQIPTTDGPMPIDPGRWHARQSLEYEIGANYAILEYASRYRERLLFDKYRAARNSIERGSRDNWTRYPSRIEQYGQDAIRLPELRDARMYIMPANQPDFGTAQKFAQRLIWTGVQVHRTTREAHGYPAGSLVVLTNQPYRPHVLDMFEPQDHPNDFLYPGGPPIRPYDSAGYTLAFQMGVVFDRLLDPIELPLERIDHALGRTVVGRSGSGLLVSGTQNDAFALVNHALRHGARVTRLTTTVTDAGRTFGPGSFFVTGAASALQAAIEATECGEFVFTDRDFHSQGRPQRAVKVGLWDRYGGSMPSGWTRWLFEQFGFDFEVVYPPQFDLGGLREKYDVLVFVTGAIPGNPGAPSGGGELANDPTIPFDLRMRMGDMSRRSVEAIRQFVEQGGHVVAIGSSATALARLFELPVRSALMRPDEAGRLRPVPDTDFYIPGSVLRVGLTPNHDLTLGMPEEVDVMFNNSPSFAWESDVSGGTVAQYTTDRPLRSGWAWGQELLKDSVAVADVPLGPGRVVLYGPEVLFRAQPHGTFKLVFNAIYRPGLGT